jgi:hydrogenase expression/formation protein HypE
VDVVKALRTAGVPIRAMRDATRGGVGAVLQEWAEVSGKTLAIADARVPVTATVRGACELLGLDPIHVANEGTMVVAVPAGELSRALNALLTVAESAGAACIGRVEDRGFAPVVMQRATGQRVPLDEPIGAPLPRIC